MLSMMTLWTGLKQQYSASDDTIGPNKEEDRIIFRLLYCVVKFYAYWLSIVSKQNEKLRFKIFFARFFAYLCF